MINSRFSMSKTGMMKVQHNFCQVIFDRYSLLFFVLFSTNSQILPLITETIRWFDISILVDFWSQYLSRDTPLYFFAGCIALKYSIAHAGKLRQFMDQPPSTWKVCLLCRYLDKKNLLSKSIFDGPRDRKFQDVECCRRSAMTVFCSVNNGLQAWLPKVIRKKYKFACLHGEISIMSKSCTCKVSIITTAMIAIWFGLYFFNLCLRLYSMIFGLKRIFAYCIFSLIISTMHVFLLLLQILSSLRNVVIYDRITMSSLEVVLARQVFLPLDVHSKEVDF